jgi:transaldolase
MNLLKQLKTLSKVVADTGDFESIKKFNPVDATTNPSLIYNASQNPRYTKLIDDAVAYAKHHSKQKNMQLSIALDKLFVDFGLEILKIVPGRVSTETDARLSFDTDAIISKSRELILMYEEAGVDRNRILIKIASTWEGIKAAEKLTKEGIHCNLTLLFSMPQAVACAEANVQLISPFVGRILDWHSKNNDNNQKLAATEEAGVILVKNIFNYYKKFKYQTEIMAASFRNIKEIIALSGCDLLTISPKFLSDLEQSEGKLEQQLLTETAIKSDLKKTKSDEKTFRWMMNEDAMATEKLAEGIRKFTEDIQKIENILIQRL